MDQLEGILAVNKPAGWTSHDVVAKVRRLLKMKRIGHTGTLDPAVTGVLPLALGRATRYIEYLQEMPKEYEAEMTVGFATDTEDLSGEVIERAKEVNLSREQVERVIEGFIGEIQQVPPMYSAVRVAGRRLYELAREGVEVERPVRTVQIHRIQLEAVHLEEKYPRMKFRVLCSKGTYIRTLCKDIGRALGYPAVMSMLVRTLSCGIPLDRCWTIEEITELLEEGMLHSQIIPVDQVLTNLPELRIDEKTAKRLLQGQRVKRAAGSSPAQGLVRVYDPNQRFVGICKLQRHLIVPHKMNHT